MPVINSVACRILLFNNNNRDFIIEYIDRRILLRISDVQRFQFRLYIKMALAARPFTLVNINLVRACNCILNH